MEQLAPNPVMTSFLAACTPGYYNNEGQGPSPHSLLVGYQHGAPAYFRYIDQWRSVRGFRGPGVLQGSGLAPPPGRPQRPELESLVFLTSSSHLV